MIHINIMWNKVCMVVVKQYGFCILKTKLNTILQNVITLQCKVLVSNCWLCDCTRDFLLCSAEFITITTKTHLFEQFHIFIRFQHNLYDSNTKHVNKIIMSSQKSSLSENWASSCSRGSSTSSESSMRYVVYKQPLSLDRFFIHDVTIPESASCRLEAAFVLVSLNRFQQVVTIHTFQAPSDQSKVS